MRHKDTPKAGKHEPSSSPTNTCPTKNGNATAVKVRRIIIQYNMTAKLFLFFLFCFFFFFFLFCFFFCYLALDIHAQYFFAKRN